MCTLCTHIRSPLALLWWTQFRLRANWHIGLRRMRGYNSLPLEFAYLTLEEVLAVRLYSGPAYQPINEFLRQIGQCAAHSVLA